MSLRDIDGPIERPEEALSRLFADYRAALPDPDPSPEFMPRLWRRIEAKQSAAHDLKRLAQGFVTAAAAVSLLIGMLLARHQPYVSPFYTNTYLEILASDQSDESEADVEIVRADYGSPDRSQ
jgi:hypothetical protein